MPRLFYATGLDQLNLFSIELLQEQVNKLARAPFFLKKLYSSVLFETVKSLLKIFDRGSKGSLR